MPQLTASRIEAFSGVYLSPKYDQPQPTPEFHRECWARYCSDAPAAATAAPRNHAKSTGLTHDFSLAVVCFRVESYVIIIGSSEEMAIEHLGDIATELGDNEELRRDFKIKDILTKQKTDIIVECTDGYQFRLLARGAEQKIRGRKWNGKRPGLIIGDDLEDDEQVESRDRRKKFRRWFFRAAKQSLRDGGKIRVHGTILHVDSLLSHLIKNHEWHSRLYKAHASFSDFTSILWPEKFPAERLKAIRQEFINEGDSAGYSQEYLNDPKDNDDSFLKKEDFIPMSEEDREAPKKFYVGCDFAVSKLDTANRTSYTVGGQDIRNILHFTGQSVGRWDTTDIVNELFVTQLRWNPEIFFVEDGVIWKVLWPVIQQEMQDRNIWINFRPILPMKEKKVRGRPYQARMRARGCRYDKEASWYEEFEEEVQTFTGDSEAVLDDQFDSAAILCKGLADLAVSVEEEDFESEEMLEFGARSRALKSERASGRSNVTGY
jgi:hypothetical protein